MLRLKTAFPQGVHCFELALPIRALASLLRLPIVIALRLETTLREHPMALFETS